jgi:hypothetical protein
MKALKASKVDMTKDMNTGPVEIKAKVGAILQERNS